ncbi:9029_t:CDS:2, partial [Paraglomus brasilianum]
DFEEMALDRNHCHTRLFLLVCEFLDYLVDEFDEKSNAFADILTVQHRLSRLLSSRVFLRSTEFIFFLPHERLTLLKDMINEAMRTDPAREQIKEWCDKLNDCAKQKKLRHGTIENLQNEIPELKAKVKLLEKEIKEIEVQLKNHHSGIDTESDDARSEESASGVTARQRAVARAQAARDAEEALRVKRIRAAEEAESLERLIGIKQLEYDNLVSLNTTEREDLKNSLVGGSVIRAAGNSANHELYQFAQLGQDRYCRNYWFYRPIGGIFVEDVEWYRSYNKERMDSNGKAAENGEESSDGQPKRQSRWWVIDSIEAYRALKNSLNPRGVRERALEASLKKIEDEVIESFKRLNQWIERRSNDNQEIQQENVERDAVKKALQRDGDIHKIVARIARDMSTLTVYEYECIMCEAIRRKLKVFEACLIEIRPDLVIEQADFDLDNCSKPEKFFEYVKKLISSTGIVMSEPTNDEGEPASAKTATSSNEEQSSNDQSPSFKWLAIASSRWYWSDIRTFSSVCAMLDELIEAHDVDVKANAKLKKANKSLSRGLSKKNNDTTDAEDEDTDGATEEGRSRGRGGKDIIKVRTSRRLKDKPKINYDENSINKCGGSDESLNFTISKYQTRSASRLRPDQTLIQDEMMGPVTVSSSDGLRI